MSSKDTETKSKFPLPLTIAIISVLGSILVAIITKWPFGNTTQDIKTVKIDSPMYQNYEIPLSNCDKFKLAIKDVPLKFKNFKGDIISDDNNETIYQSKYVFDNSVSRVVYDKQDLTYILEIILYEGADSLLAKRFFDKNIIVLDACLTTKFKQKPLFSFEKDRHYIWIDYLTEDFDVGITYNSNATKKSSAIISISKNSE